MFHKLHTQYMQPSELVLPGTRSIKGFNIIRLHAKVSYSLISSRMKFRSKFCSTRDTSTESRSSSLNFQHAIAVASLPVNRTDPAIQNKLSKRDVHITGSLKELQTVEQRQILDTVAQVRKCRLDSILSLLQLVVCGDQSAGKSSVLKALTEIPFPQNNNLYTRFATEIILRHAPKNSLTIKIIPDKQQPVLEQTTIKGFEESITDLEKLPKVMRIAMEVIGRYSHKLFIS
jgi:hypothetical protein